MLTPVPTDPDESWLAAADPRLVDAAALARLPDAEATLLDDVEETLDLAGWTVQEIRAVLADWPDADTRQLLYLLLDYAAPLSYTRSLDQVRAWARLLVEPHPEHDDVASVHPLRHTPLCRRLLEYPQRTGWTDLAEAIRRYETAAGDRDLAPLTFAAELDLDEIRALRDAGSLTADALRTLAALRGNPC